MAKWQKFRKPSAAGKPRYEFDHVAFATGLHVFVDGACEPNPGPGGWGVAVYRDGVEIASDHGGHAETTNNRMELTGLLRGIETAKTLGAPAILWCDSQYAVKGANEWMHNWKRCGWKKPGNEELKNIDLWQSIDDVLASANQLTIRWCKGHAGIVGNERADELSNLGIASLAGVSPVREPVDYLTAEYRSRMAE